MDAEAETHEVVLAAELNPVPNSLWRMRMSHLPMRHTLVFGSSRKLEFWTILCSSLLEIFSPLGPILYSPMITVA